LVGLNFVRVLATHGENVVDDVLPELGRPLTGLVADGVRPPELLGLLG